MYYFLQKNQDCRETDTVKLTPKNYRETVEYGGFISHWNHNHCQKCFFSLRRASGQAESIQTCCMGAESPQCGSCSAEVTHLSLIPHAHITKPLFIHKSPPSSHLEPIFTLWDTQAPLTGADLACPSPAYESPGMISPQFISLYKHRLICAHT